MDFSPEKTQQQSTSTVAWFWVGFAYPSGEIVFIFKAETNNQINNQIVQH